MTLQSFLLSPLGVHTMCVYMCCITSRAPIAMLPDGSEAATGNTQEQTVLYPLAVRLWRLYTTVVASSVVLHTAVSLKPLRSTFDPGSAPFPVGSPQSVQGSVLTGHQA